MRVGASSSFKLLRIKAQQLRKVPKIRHLMA
jgi:hypothetical protein